MSKIIKRIKIVSIGNIISKIRDNQILVIVLSIIVLAILVRIWQLNSLPKNLSSAEVDQLEKMANIVKNNWRVESQDIYNALYLYIYTVVGWITKFNVMTFKVIQTFIGIVTVLVFFMFTKEWFNTKIALFSALFLTISSFHLAISREIEPAILTPIVIILIPYLLTLGRRTGHKRWFILWGFISGLSFYVDKIFILLPLVFCSFLIYSFYKNPKIFKKFLGKYLYFVPSFLLASMPFIIIFSKNISKIMNDFNPGSFGQYFVNLGTNVQSLIYQSTPNQLYYVGLEPIFSPFIAITFVAGVIYALFHIERRQYFFLIILFASLIVGISLERKQSTINLLPVLPLVIVFSSIILDCFLKNWLRTFPFNKMARIFLTLTFSLFIFLTVYYSYEAYFLAWGKNETIQSQFSHTFEYKK